MAQEKENRIQEGCKTSLSRQNFQKTTAETLPETTWEASCLLFWGGAGSSWPGLETELLLCVWPGGK